MKISLFVSLCCSVVFYSYAGQAACVQPPSCEELGFTVDASKCEGAALKCPWNLSKAACKEKEEIEVGAILYGDGTVAIDIIDGKTPIGIVFDVEKRLAMALTDVKKDGTSGSEAIYWSFISGDIPDLENCNDSDISPGANLTSISCGTNGRLNTDSILASTHNGTTYAATATSSYQPIGCIKDFCKKTKWFLPSLRDLQNIYMAKDRLNTILILLKNKGAFEISEYNYWSSTEADYSNSWQFNMNDGTRYRTAKDYYSFYVRPVLAF